MDINLAPGSIQSSSDPLFLQSHIAAATNKTLRHA